MTDGECDADGWRHGDSDFGIVSQTKFFAIKERIVRKNNRALPLVLAAVMCFGVSTLAGCKKEADKPTAETPVTTEQTSTADTSAEGTLVEAETETSAEADDGGFSVQTPTTNVRIDSNGLQVDAPGTKVRVGSEGIKIQAPGTDVDL